MARIRTLTIAALACLLAVPMGAIAQEEETEHLPSWAEQELEAAGHVDPTEQANAIPAPPHELSQPQQVQAVPPQSQARDVDFDTFYLELSDHGTWVETPEYGYVFIPHRQAEVRDWRPYYYGSWIWTRHGWTWVSEEPFGWATYHYGRWAMVGSYGWVWVPGYTWGPAWVAWRWGDSAIGWAPLYPGYVSYSSTFPIYHHHWVYIGPRYFYAHPIYRHHHHHRRASYYYRHTHRGSHWYRPGNRSHVYAGPPRSRVERHAPGRRIVETRMERTHRRGRGHAYAAGKAPERIEVYRPDRRRVRSSEVVRNVPRNDRAPRVGSGLVSQRHADRRLDAPRVDGRTRRAVPSPRADQAPRAQRNERRVAPGADRVRQPGGARVDPRAAPNRDRAAPRVAPRAPESRGQQRVAPRSSAPTAPRVQPRSAAPSAPRAQPAPTAPRLRQDDRGTRAPRTIQPRSSAPTAPRVRPPSNTRSAPTIRAPSNTRAAPKIRTPSSSNRSAPKIRAPSSSSRSAPKIRAPSSSSRSAPKIRAPRGSARSAPKIRAPSGSRSGPRAAPRRSR